MTTSKNLSSIILLVALSLFLSMPINAHANSPIYYVAPSPTGTGTSGGSCSAPGYNNIQPAVNAAPADSLIIVCPGTYTEQVTVSKTLALKGSGLSTTKVLLPSTLLVPDGFGQINVVTINGGGITVSISGFTISGPGPGLCNSINYGIFVSGGATAQISHNSIVHIRDTPFGGCQNGGGIRVGSNFLATTGTATIVSNSISDYQKGGIVVDGVGSSATVYGNTVTGVGPTPAIAQNGIQVSRGAKATVSHNTVSKNECNNPTCGPDFETQYSSAGILLFNNVVGPLAATVSNNNVFANDIGVLPDQVTGTSLSQNTITDNRFSNLALFTSNNNVIEENTISVSSATAKGAPCGATSFCFSHSYTLGIDILDSSNGNTVSRNTVTVTADPYAILLDTSTSGNSVICNSLSANHGATTGNAAVQDLGTGNKVNNSCCGEEDGNGDFQGQQQGNFQMDNDGCMDGDQNQVSSSNVGDGKDFKSTQISTTRIDAAAHTVTIIGIGTHGGVPVAFTFVAVETGPTTPGWVSFVFSDGYTNAGTLTNGVVVLH
jgi:hypothetical protein